MKEGHSSQHTEPKIMSQPSDSFGGKKKIMIAGMFWSCLPPVALITAAIIAPWRTGGSFLMEKNR